jgi:hypothetical protein
VKILLRIIGAVIGAAFGLLASVALIRSLSDGNIVEEGFLFLPGAPVSLLVGAFAGAIMAMQAARRLGAKSISTSGRREKRRFILALVLGIPAAFVAVIWIAREAVEPPSDAAMLLHFDRHEGALDTLAKMADADKGLDRVDQDWTMPADTRSVGVSSERLADYRRLLRDTGTPRGFQVSQGHDGLNFLFWLRGSAISDDTDKGFAYRTTPPPRTVQSLDNIRTDSRNALIVYRHIRGNWYLFYEFIPD